jgi:hypothetical protein
MSYIYTSTGRFFIENPYNPQTDITPFTSDTLIQHLSTIDQKQFSHEGNIIIGEYTIDDKYFFPVLAFSHHIWTHTGKISKQFKQSLEMKTYTEDFLPSRGSTLPYEKFQKM